MTKFKVGDRVIQPHTFDTDVSTIVKASVQNGLDTYTLEYPGGRKSQDWWHNDELELVTSKEGKESKYKVGDVVPKYLLNGIARYPEGGNAKSRGIKVGEKAIALDESYWPRGTVIELETDDDSTNPLWTNKKDNYFRSFTALAPLSAITNQSKENKPMGRRTFKLVKAMPGIKVGTLFQEECEDGTQPYSPMESVAGVTIQFTDRSQVEDSKHFVEVFKVHPEYMTQEELDKWNAFKGQKKRGRPAKKESK